MLESITVSPALRHHGIIVSLEDDIILYNIVSCVNEDISGHSGTALGIIPDW